jgi:hypothetical protein
MTHARMRGVEITRPGANSGSSDDAVVKDQPVQEG